MNRIAEIRERLARITPGPWKQAEIDPELVVQDNPDKVVWIAGCDFMADGQLNGRNNADFIAKAPDDITFLLAEIERLQQECGAGMVTEFWLEEERDRLQGEVERLRQENENLQKELESLIASEHAEMLMPAHYQTENQRYHRGGGKR